MKYLSLFSGIEAASVAWHDFGTPVAFSEIEPFPCAVLAHHYPDTPNLGDVTKITEEQIKAIGPIDVVVFGSPCQDLSVAGKRKGMTDAEGNITRSGLFFSAINIAHWARKHCGCRFALWENVPGAFSSNKGADFTEVVKHLAGLDELDTPANGWGTEGAALGTNLVEWAVLDAQFFGVAQRRRRVFALADFGDWAGRPPLLLERDSLRGNSPPRRKAGEEVAGTISARTKGGGGFGTDFECAGGLQPVRGFGIGFHTTGAGYWQEGPGTLRARKQESHEHVICMAHGQGGAEINEELCPTLNCNHEQPIVFGVGEKSEVGHCLRSGASKADKHESTTYVCPTGYQVRRLTPIECARLQGFPDNYLDIQFRNKPAADGNKYKALGNSMAVPVMRHIGLKIKAVLDSARDFSELC